MQSKISRPAVAVCAIALMATTGTSRADTLNVTWDLYCNTASPLTGGNGAGALSIHNTGDTEKTYEWNLTSSDPVNAILLPDQGCLRG